MSPTSWRASLVTQLVKNLPAMQETRSIPGSGRSTGEEIGYPLQYPWASLVAQLVKNPPAMRETWVWSLGWEDPLEKRTATRSRILAWRIPWTVQSLGLQRVRHDWATFTFTFIPILKRKLRSPGVHVQSHSGNHRQSESESKSIGCQCPSFQISD